MLQPNPSPRLLDQLVARGTFRDDPLTLVDVGVRGGFEGEWSRFGDQIQLVGFEPDPAEYERLTAQATGRNRRYFAVALHRDAAVRTFFVTQFPPSSGFYKPDPRFMERIRDGENLRVLKEIPVSTVDLDTFLAQHPVGQVDFIKLDVEGAELDILHGARRTLLGPVFGLSVEVGFHPYHEGQPLFADVDSFLRSCGFCLFELQPYRHARQALPEAAAARNAPSAHGQVLWGQALYLRDAVAEIDRSGTDPGPTAWPATRILKLASVLDLHNLADCAAELLLAAANHGLLKSVPVGTLLDLLVPELTYGQASYLGLGGVRRHALTYDQYRERIAAADRAGGTLVDRRHRFAGAKRALKHLLPRAMRRSLKRLIEEFLQH